MQVYGHRAFSLNLPSFIGGLHGRVEAVHTCPLHDDIVGLLIDFAEAESACADALFAHEDDERTELGPWRRSLDTLTAAFCASCVADVASVRAHLNAWRKGIVQLALPATETVQARSAEGFSCYALYPEQYVEAAQQFAACEPDGPVVCLGLRSIGSVLGAVVASELRRTGRQVETRSVRPRGHPFDRHLSLGAGLQRFIHERRNWWFLVVDEGPGISGSSLAAGADCLSALGVPLSRITLVPAWRPDPRELRSERARRAFSTHRVIVGRSPITEVASRALQVDTPHDMSGGLWRRRVYPEPAYDWPAVHPQHERVKFVDNADAPRMAVRFAGLGRHGRIRIARARTLHEHGFGSTPIALDNGLLTLEWIPGTPASRSSLLESSSGSVEVSPRSRVTLERMADYAACIARAFPTGIVDDGDDLKSMLRENAEAMNREDAHNIEAMISEARLDGPRIEVDGRMLPYEWLWSDDRLVKVDALDHHADDFLPGCRDIAWDLAGAIVEWQMPDAAATALVDRFVTASGDRDVRRRLPFFLSAYAAYRFGYAALAADSLAGTPDGDAFTRSREWYRRSLAAHAARLRQPGAR